MKFILTEINLRKFYLINLFSLIVSFSFSMLIVLILLRLNVSLPSDGNYTFLIYLALVLTISTLSFKIFNNYYVRKLEISLNEKELKINGIRTFQIDDIENYKTKASFRNYPSFELKLKDKSRFKFYCKNKVDNDYDLFISEFDKIIKLKK